MINKVFFILLSFFGGEIALAQEALMPQPSSLQLLRSSPIPDSIPFGVKKSDSMKVWANEVLTVDIYEEYGTEKTIGDSVFRTTGVNIQHKTGTALQMGSFVVEKLSLSNLISPKAPISRGYDEKYFIYDTLCTISKIKKIYHYENFHIFENGLQIRRFSMKKGHLEIDEIYDLSSNTCVRFIFYDSPPFKLRKIISYSKEKLIYAKYFDKKGLPATIKMIEKARLKERKFMKKTERKHRNFKKKQQRESKK